MASRTTATQPPPDGATTAAAPANEKDHDGLTYLHGFGNTFESEYIENALPRGRNTPRNVPYNLYTEQLSGTAFTCPRATNRRTWMYRIEPSVSGISNKAEPIYDGYIDQYVEIQPPPSNIYFGGGSCPPNDCEANPNPLRWNPLPCWDSEYDFIDGTVHMCTAGGDASSKNGISIYMYAFGQSMKSSSSSSSQQQQQQQNRHFCNTDGDMLFVPAAGGPSLEVITELGKMIIKPGNEIFVIPRGIVFQINLLIDTNGDNNDENNDNDDDSYSSSYDSTKTARGYILECYKGGFQLPELGPIGSNGLANARDFQHPTAWCDFNDRNTYQQDTCITSKMDSKLYTRQSNHSPYNVVAWHGNYLPYKYDLTKFCAVNSVTYDHLDPSVYTVLTCPSSLGQGTALVDFVIFPHRYMATDPNTFRPPWFHRNTMSEFMGLLSGQYDAKEGDDNNGKKGNGGGFQPGGASLHNIMTPHGPDNASYRKAVADPCDQPKYYDGGLAFMFESCYLMKVSPNALSDENGLDEDYAKCWDGLDDTQFTGWDMLLKKPAADAKAAAKGPKDS